VDEFRAVTASAHVPGPLTAIGEHVLAKLEHDVTVDDSAPGLEQEPEQDHDGLDDSKQEQNDDDQN
jgi:hypothetical protein